MLNPYPDCPTGYDEYDFFPDDDEPVRLSAMHGEWLRELCKHFTLVWATGWGEDANRHLCPHFGLPALPTIVFPPVPFGPAEKVPPIDAFAGDHAFAWIDDLVTEEARRWARERTHPTLLVEVNHSVGLTRDLVDEVMAWRLTLG